MAVQTQPDQTLHALAEQWARTEQEVRRKEDEARRAKDEADRLRNRLTTIGQSLLKRVGSNITTRVFAVSTDEVVIVEHERGVRLEKITPRDAS